MSITEKIRFATFNVSLNRNEEGELSEDLSTPDNEPAKAIAEIIQRNNPDVILLNEFDYDPEGKAIALFQENYLEVSQNGVDPIEYPYVYLAPSNTGIPSGLDLDNDGTTDGAGDAFGFGFFPGQFGMVLLSKYPIDNENVRTFQNFLWKDLPGGLLPDDPNTPEPNDYYSPEELEVLRLSSKSHWDIPIEINGEIIHVLASHPTPPVFDGEEDRNGRRNHDEIRFWADYITPGKNSYIYDDLGNYGGLPAGESFVILGDQNADPFDGDSTNQAILQLLENPFINNQIVPDSEGGIDATLRQGGANDSHLGNPVFDTADFNDETSGNLRVDYVLPSQDLVINNAEVFWPTSDDPLFNLVGDFDPNLLPTGFPSSDHRLVFTDVSLTPALGDRNRKTVTNLDFLGEVTFPTGFSFADTEVGGISGLTYDPFNNLYYALSDDRGAVNDARFYNLSINLDDGSLDQGDVEFLDVNTLLNVAGSPFAEASIDPEGIAFSDRGTVFISSEGDANNLIDPLIGEFSLDGQIFAELPIPEKFLPTVDGKSGIRNNLAFESLTITPDRRFLFTAVENALIQDGEEASLTDESPVRILQYDLTTDRPVKEFLYFTDSIPVSPDPADGFADNGLVELLAIDNTGTFLALERSFAEGVGNNLRLYEVRLQGATDLSSFDSLTDEEGETIEVDAVAQKKLLLDFRDLGIQLDNSEAISFGPTLPDGRQSLIVASANNFSDNQITQFLAFGIDLQTIPTVAPTVETPSEIRFGDPENNQPDADDPAIYVHPSDPGQSFVITTLKNGGLAVYDLQGNQIQKISPENIRYNNVDLAYGVKYTNQLGKEAEIDLAIASDRANDTLAIYAIDPETRQLTEVTVTNLSTIFGVDDGEQTAYGLATYTSLVDGKNYVFVSQAGSNQIAQLELIPQLTAADEFSVAAKTVRTIAVPIPEGEDLDAAQVEGMVVDRELGYLYVGQENFGIWKFSAEPNGSNEGVIVDTVDEVKPDGNQLAADVEGLTIYYGADGQGYLLASSQGDNTFAVYDRAGSNSYLGSFAVGEGNGIDGVEESDGADLINLPLSEQFPNGLLVVHDGSNEPAVVLPDPEDGEIQNFNTNFKYINLADFSNLFPNLPPQDPNSFNPRHPQPNTLINGIASGDTTQDSTVLWARSTVLGTVTFEYSTDPNFREAIAVTAEVEEIDLPVKVAIDDLRSGTDYYYRVTDAAGDVEIGQFTTAVELGTYAGLRFGVSGDWRGELAPYPAISNVTDRDLAFFVEHGDTIYADIASDAVKNPDGTRKDQVETLEEYRLKHSEVYSSRFGSNTWADLRANTSIFATIDDHEVTNDFAGGAEADTDDRFTEESGLINDTELFENGLQAFQEYNPLQDEFYEDTGDPVSAGERKLYRYQTYGSDAATFVLDTRSFRDRGLTPPADFNDPQEISRVLTESLTLDRTLLGEAQLNDLKQDLLSAQADGITWKFVMIPEPIQNLFPGINVDSYEGYLKERAELLRFIEDNQIDNVVFVAADVHMTAVNNLTYQTEPLGEQIATNVWEITTGAVAFDPPTGEFLADSFTADNPELKALYDSLPVAPDLNDNPDDKDDFVKGAINDNLLKPLGFDPLGLDDNLPQAEGLIDATLLQGDYFVSHTYGWTEFDIDPETQQLKVTTYGVEAYDETEIIANPNLINSLTPQVVSEFVVNPVIDAEQTNNFTPVFGTVNDDTLEVGVTTDFSGHKNLVFAGEGNDLIDLSQGTGENRVYGDGGDDTFFLGTNDLVVGGEGADRFWIANAAFPESANTITDFESGVDGIGFEDLSITQDGDNALIAARDKELAILLGVDAASLSADNFAFA
jgi:3-phytase/alkaline phosphatase D